MPITAFLIAIYQVLQLDACCSDEGKQQGTEFFHICKLMLNSDLSQVSVKAGSSRLFPSQKTWMQVWNRDPAEQMANRGCQALCCFIWLQRVMNSPNTSYSGFVEETHGDCDKEGSKDLGSWVTGSRLRQPGEASTAAPQSSVLVMMPQTAEHRGCRHPASPHCHWLSDCVCYFLPGGNLLFVWTGLPRCVGPGALPVFSRSS
ncbi:uncharacterized protein LOC110365678 [Columba livia]|uniref:uncharacterized protein LOC110365678 n=1 Tax=Columba livia TaxID=8932 RepID=UPI0031BA6DEE